MSPLSASASALVRVERTLAVWREPIRHEMSRWIPADGPYDEILYEPIRRHALRPGKGLRPVLCLTACRALGGSAEAALPTAAVLELYHNAFLVHDDVEDGSVLRREAPSLHAVYGVPIAVNAGDAMLALALPPLLDNTRVLGVGKSLRVLEVIASMARETAEGQAVELDWIRRGVASPTEDQYVEMVSKKTGSYSFIAPLTLGALIAGAGEVCIEHLKHYGRCVGVAFQIRDDVLNLRSPGGRWGKDPLDDLWEAKRTLVLSHALQRASEPERARAHAALLGPRSGRQAEDVEFLFQLIQRAGSLDAADAIAQRFAERAHEALQACTPWLSPSEHREFLGDLIEFVRQRDY